MNTQLCAIYTRKSSEEGLEQGFNSLNAQRESCEAYVLSQRHEGWKALSTCYDDGGYSGGTLERPALKQLLADVGFGKIKVVVVYKVDRLTRSLADFAKIVELFDRHGVSFVSVTQQFNTTTSMGRLTLNVLLSFAQFEREVTGERIRDKIAASKKKGMWMGGIVPLGYAAHERTLVIDEASAPLIREVYRLYLELGTVRFLKEELDRRACVTPIRNTQRPGASGGRPFSRGNLYRILSNPIYAGNISHKRHIYPGQHPALIDTSIWDAVQRQLSTNKQGRGKRVYAKDPSLLAALVFDEQGVRLTPTHANKSGRRYRYYLSHALLKERKEDVEEALRIPAHELESVVVNGLVGFLTDRGQVLNALSLSEIESSRRTIKRASHLAAILQQESDSSQPSTAISVIQDLVRRITVGKTKVQVEIKTAGLHVVPQTPSSHIPETITLSLPVTLKRCGMAIRLIVDASRQIDRKLDPKLIGLIVKAQDWFSRLSSGKADSIFSIAQTEQVTGSYVTRVIYLAFLAPDIVDAIITGKQPPTLTADRLIRSVPLPRHWPEQRIKLGFSQR